MLFSELKKEMKDFNTRNGIKRKVDIKRLTNGELVEMVGKVVLKQELFDREYSKEQRTYTFSNYNKALTSNDLGYSIFAYSKELDACDRIEDLDDNHIEMAEIISTIE